MLRRLSSQYFSTASLRRHRLAKNQRTGESPKRQAGITTKKVDAVPWGAASTKAVIRTFLFQTIKLAGQEEITPVFSKKVRIQRHKKLDKSMLLC